MCRLHLWENMLAEQEAGSQGHVEISGISLQSLIFWAAFLFTLKLVNVLSGYTYNFCLGK